MERMDAAGCPFFPFFFSSSPEFLFFSLRRPLVYSRAVVGKGSEVEAGLATSAGRPESSLFFLFEPLFFPLFSYRRVSSSLGVNGQVIMLSEAGRRICTDSPPFFLFPRIFPPPSSASYSRRSSGRIEWRKGGTRRHRCSPPFRCSLFFPSGRRGGRTSAYIH